ncbi:MAG TPA: PqiC family protein [Candidatus Binatia bacterium]|nr:PqiC family protein [Candidatus Binatia bacterium]
MRNVAMLRTMTRTLAALLARPAFPVLLTITLALAGCGFSLAPTPDPTVFFVLSPVESAEPQRQQSSIHVGLGPISLPEYTAETKIVRRTGEASVDYIPMAQWAEPVEDGFSRALLQDLIGHLGSPYVVMYPWYATRELNLSIPVNVVRFETAHDGSAVLTARWRVEEISTRRLIVSRESRIVEPAAGPGTDAVVAALNRAIDRLAREMSTTLLSLRRQ